MIYTIRWHLFLFCNLVNIIVQLWKIYFLHVVVWKLGVTFKGVDPIMGESDPAKRDDRLYILLWLELKVFLEKSWHEIFYATEVDILTDFGSLELINSFYNLSLICLVS